jgi:hypothetical protein
MLKADMGLRLWLLITLISLMVCDRYVEVSNSKTTRKMTIVDINEDDRRSSYMGNGYVRECGQWVKDSNQILGVVKGQTGII